MQAIVSRLILAGLALGLILPAAAQAQDDAAEVFKTNCVLCHSANGSGDSTAGKALKAKDLRSPEVQKQTNAALAQRNGALDAEVRDLKQGFEAIEERARYELGMIKQDEVFYQVVRPADSGRASR